MPTETEPEYRRPRLTERRKTRQPFKLDKFPAVAREAVLDARSKGKTWEEIAEIASRVAQQPITARAVLGWYEQRVEQVKRDMLVQAERAREISAALTAKGYQKLPEAVRAALASNVFAIMEASGAGGEATLRKALLDFGWLLSDMQRTEVAQEKLRLERKHLRLETKKFELARAKFDEATTEIVQKPPATPEERQALIDKIRMDVFGLPPCARNAGQQSGMSIPTGE